MNLDQIKTAVDAGKTVHWSNPGYRVIKSKYGEHLIVWNLGGRDENCIGLTWRDGITMNGKESEFYIGD